MRKIRKVIGMTHSRILAIQLFQGVFEMIATRCRQHIGAPKVYHATQTLAARDDYLVDKYGGQRQNRTAETGDFQ